MLQPMRTNLTQKNFELFFKNPLTNPWECAIITPVVKITVRPQPSGDRDGATQRDLKNFRKTFQKPLDKIETMCYNVQVVVRQPSAGLRKKNLKKFSKNFSKTS